MSKLKHLAVNEELVLLVLASTSELNSEEEFYGLQIIESISKHSNGSLSLATGTLYPVLRRLEKRGFLSSRWEANEENSNVRGGARRRYYKITREGINALNLMRSLRSDICPNLNLQPGI